VIINQRIITTKVRAKLARSLVDRLVTLGKDVDSLAARRRAFSFLQSHDLVKKLFTEIAPMFSEKNGGYTRIIPYKRRRGDNAELVVLELSIQKVYAKAVKKEKTTAKKEPIDVPKQDAVAKAAPEKVEHKHEHKDRKGKEVKKPSKKSLAGFGKFFKAERDSL
jgi:large subunit ribosomal protein L17